MFQTLAAIVHILDVTFNPREEGVELSNPSLTSVIAGLLQIDPRELALCLVQEAMITRGTYVCMYTVYVGDGVTHSKTNFCFHCYHQLSDFLFEQFNFSLVVEPSWGCCTNV